MPPRVNVAEVESMRDLGRSLMDKGFFELDLMSSKIVWMNEFSLSKIGMSVQQIRNMTIYDMVPEEFHESLNNFVADSPRGKNAKFYIWPVKTSDGKVSWWYYSRVGSNHPIHWYKAEFLNKTASEGHEYSSMWAAMHTANNYSDLYNRVVDLEDMERDHFNRHEGEIEEVKGKLDNLERQISGSIVASNRAANKVLELSSMFENFQNGIQDTLSNHTTEILRLISTDTIHDQRLKLFEEHIKTTTDKAVKEITSQANEVGQIIKSQANKAGQNISKKIVIPIGSIAIITAIAQWIISYIMKTR